MSKLRARNIKFTREAIMRVGLAHILFHCAIHKKAQHIAQLEREHIVLACGCKVEIPKQ